MPEQVQPQKKSLTNMIVKNRRALLLLLLIAGIFYVYMMHIPLPSDQELISTFRARRIDIDELVRRYRAYSPGPNQSHHLWVNQGDTQAMMRRAGVQSISDTTLGLWFPDPYAPANDGSREGLLGKDSFRLKHTFGALRVTLDDPRYRQAAIRHGGVVWKDLLFFPEPPRIENGRLIGPMYHGRPQYRLLVLSSLDKRPFAWLSTSIDDCVVRPIEPNWFIKLCRSH